ncbi:MAG TPA: VWA domain-containing protein, partial [Humisphaera sp.]|nr:VWA domain-containing protein [Humisphaera sp.]
LLVIILASLVLAAANLSLGGSPIKARSVVVIIDVSASMNAAIDGKSNLARAKEAAERLIASLDSGAQVAVVEASNELRVLRSLGEGSGLAIAKVQRIEPFDGPGEMRRTLAEAWKIWGARLEAQVYVFTDNELPPTNWGERAHAWIAPAVGAAGNASITAISAERSPGDSAGERGRDVTVHFTLANYAPERRVLSGVIEANGNIRGTFDNVALDSGQTTRRTVTFEETGVANVLVKLAGNADALAADDIAAVQVPALDELRVGVYWEQANRRNDYVSAALSAMQDQGVVGPIVENPPAPTPVGVYVNHFPAAWPDGGAIVLYPLRSGVVEVAGLHKETVTVARQAQHELLAGVDLRGLAVKDAVQLTMPQWATPLVWADNNMVLAWAGQTGKTRVLFVGIPMMPSGSRLPLMASFPALMRNTLQWMLPKAEALHPGDTIGDWTSRNAGLVKGNDGRVHAFSVASALESDLRRPAGLTGETFGKRHSLAKILVLIAAALLPLEWGLFHKRLTE